VYPSYPAAARRLGVQGTARLRVQVQADGRVGEILVEISPGTRTSIARGPTQSASGARARAAETEPVASWVLLPVEFRLK